jgi:hypothetical protein
LQWAKKRAPTSRTENRLRTDTDSIDLGVLRCIDRGQPVPSDGLISAIIRRPTWAALWRGLAT